MSNLDQHKTSLWSIHIPLEMRPEVEKTAAAKGYLCRWGEPVTIGDQYLKPPFAKALTAEHICDFTSQVAPTDVWASPSVPERVVKIIPRPSPLEPLLSEKLDLILQKLEGIEHKLRKLT